MFMDYDSFSLFCEIHLRVIFDFRQRGSFPSHVRICPDTGNQ